MEALSALLSSISTVLWPLIVIAAMVFLRPAVTDLIQSAKSRKFTIKIGGQELTMEEANEQQLALITDLQSQVADIRKRLEARDLPVQRAGAPNVPSPIPELSSVLWVDVEPKNNSYFIEELSRLGVRVDLARTTSEGLSMLGRRKYSVIISGMGRTEGGKDNFRAGLDLLKAVRQRDPKIPFFIYCSERFVAQLREEALRSGASGITASATELFAMLNLERLKKEAS